MKEAKGPRRLKRLFKSISIPRIYNYRHVSGEWLSKLSTYCDTVQAMKNISVLLVILPPKEERLRILLFLIGFMRG